MNEFDDPVLAINFRKQKGKKTKICFLVVLLCTV